mmetsp:Transcript_30979/g.79025  ORF Transcript_30979/g.79025 Transcript_30979/m.79025 type:complete len:368 (+) Transcript_30979:1865-2968(+)
MMERPAHCSWITPASSSSHSTLKAKRSTPGFRLHSSSHSRRGSMGITRCTRYTLVERRPASMSSAEKGGMKCATSAMCTPTFHLPGLLGTGWMCRASSRSLAVGGSMENTRCDLKSLRPDRSWSLTFQGVLGRHASTSGSKSSLLTPCSSRMAAVSLSISPACPSDARSSTRGAPHSVSHPVTRADMSVRDATLVPASSASAACDASASSSGDRPLTEVAATAQRPGRQGSSGSSHSSRSPPSIAPGAPACSTPTTRSRLTLSSPSPTTRPVMRSPPAGAACTAAVMEALAASTLPRLAQGRSGSPTPLPPPSSLMILSNLAHSAASSSGPMCLCTLYHSDTAFTRTTTSSPSMALFWYFSPRMSTS